MWTAADRDFYSWLLLSLAALPLFMGWLFLVAGTGVYLMTAGLAMIAVGLAIRWSWPRFAVGLSALAVGCWPLWALLVWAW